MVAALKANSILDCIKRIVASRAREMIIPLSFLVRKVYGVYGVYGKYMEHIQAWIPQHKKEKEKLLEWIQRKTTKMVRELKHLSYENKLRELGLFILK